MNISKARELLRLIAENVPRWDRELDEVQREFTAEEERRALRDRLAVAAMQGLLSGRASFPIENIPNEQVAAVAYGIADAMIKAREKVG